MRTWGRGVAVALVATALAVPVGGAPGPAGAVAGGPAAPAQAGPTVSLSPATDVPAGSQVEVTLRGFPAEAPHGLMQCDASILDDLSDRSRCVFAHISLEPVTDPFTETIHVHGAFDVPDGDGDGGQETVRCGRAPDDCAVLAWFPNSNTLAAAPIDIDLGPLFVWPMAQEVGHPVTAEVDVPGGGVRVAQCLEPVGTTLAASTCTPPLDVPPPGPGGEPVSVDVTLAGAVAGTDCTEVGCHVAAFDAGGATLGATRVFVYPQDGPPSLSFVRPENQWSVVDGQSLELQALGIRNEGWTLAQCDADVTTAAEVHTGRCGPPFAVWEPDRVVTGTSVTVVVEETIDAVDGSTVDCRARRVACVFALATNEGTLVTLPFGFRVDPVLTVSPDTGLLADQTLTLSATGLVPGARYSLLTCRDLPVGWFNDAGCAGPAAEAPVVTASDQGELTATTPALQRFTDQGGRRVVCRDDCSVLLVRAQREHWFQYVAAGYSLAEGSLAASPATGLADGDPVAVTGTDLMATYDGPLVWFVRAGSWALGQCGAGIVDEPSVAGVFRHCAVPPGGGAVEVPGSTLSAELAVQPTIAPLAGPPVDCRSGPGACVVTLARYEQDGGTTVLTTPLTFAP